MNEQHVDARVKEYANKKALYEDFASQVLTILEKIIKEDFSGY